MLLIVISEKPIIAHISGSAFGDALGLIACCYIAAHLHDTRYQALNNILISLEMGVSIIDASVAVVYLLNGMNIEAGVDLNKLIDAGNFIYKKLSRDNQSMASHIVAAKP